MRWFSQPRQPTHRRARGVCGAARRGSSRTARSAESRRATARDAARRTRTGCACARSSAPPPAMVGIVSWDRVGNRRVGKVTFFTRTRYSRTAGDERWRQVTWPRRGVSSGGERGPNLGEERGSDVLFELGHHALHRLLNHLGHGCGGRRVSANRTRVVCTGSAAVRERAASGRGVQNFAF